MAFANCDNLKSVTIPDSVTTIADMAFSGCINLTSATIPASVKSIGDLVFDRCKNLKGVSTGKENTEAATENGILFNGDKTVLIRFPPQREGHYTIPDSVTTIAGSAFADCTKLTSVTLPDSVTTIGRQAFRRCSSLKSITFPKGIISIGSYSFLGCALLTSVTIPASVTSIGNAAFRDCENLTNIVVDEGNKTYSSVDGVLFDKNKTKVLQCPTRKSGHFTIPDSVTTIAMWSFGGCGHLESLTIGKGVNRIGTWAFNNCSSLKRITFKGTQAPQMDYDPEAFRGFQFVGVPGNAKIVVRKNANGFDSKFSRLSIVVADEK